MSTTRMGRGPMRGFGKRGRLEAAAAALFVVFVGGCTPLNTAAPVGQPSTEVGGMRSGPVAGTAGGVEVPYLPAPTSIDLCGEPVPLNRESVYERFDKEFTLVVYNHAQVYLWLKRMQRYFPMIEQRLRYYGLPDDLKYVAIAESDLLPTACSPKGAAGPWQFMSGTGAAYGLKQCGTVDNRFSFERATDSAFLLLKNLDAKYHSWALALAAYNAGDKRVLDAMRVAGTHDYYALCLPLETERYVLRILAIKAVLSNPGKYGYNLPVRYGYKPLREDRVRVSLPGPVAIRTIAEAAGTTYGDIKRLNPIFRSDQIPAGSYELKLPAGTRDAFERNFKPVASAVLLARRETAAEREPARSAANRRTGSASTASHGHKSAARAKSSRSHGRMDKHPSSPAKAASSRGKGKSKPRRANSSKAKRKAGHDRPKPHGAKRKGGKSLARR